MLASIFVGTAGCNKFILIINTSELCPKQDSSNVIPFHQLVSGHAEM